MTFDAGLSDNGAVQAAFAAGATLSVKLIDLAGNEVISNVGNPAITVDYVKPTATVTFSEDPIMSTNLTQAVTVTYIESMNAGTTPTISMVTGGNWGLQAGGVWSQTSVLNDTYTATLTHDATPEYIAMEEAQTASTSGARDVNGNDDNGDTSDTSFVVDTQIPTEPTGVSFTAVGGNIVSDTLNTSNTNFTASATITVNETIGGEAELLIDGLPFASPIKDTSISGGETAVTFDADLSDNGAVQTAFAAGATVSVKLTDAAGNEITSSVGNPAITVDYVKPTPTVTFSEDPINSTTLTQTVAVTYTESMNAGTEPTITMVPGTNWGLQAGGVWSQTSVLNDTYTATLTHDGTAEYIAGQIARVSAASGARDVNGNDDNNDDSDPFVVDTEDPTEPTGVTFTAVGGNVVANTLNTSNTNFTASATIVADEATGGSAELLIGGVSFAVSITDALIGSSDTQVTFDAGFSDNSAVQTAFAIGATLSVKITDPAGNEVTSSVGNPTITVDYVKPTPTVTTSIDPIFSDSLTQTVTVTYTESMNNATEPTITMVTGGNWGLQAGGVWSQTSVVNDTYTATLMHNGTSEYIAEEVAEVVSTSGARDVNGNDDNGDTSDPFEVDTEGPTAPTGVTFTAVGGNVVADTLNTSNTNFTVSATIVDGEATGGSAELLKDGISFGTSITDTSIASDDTIVTFDAGFSDNGDVQTAFAAGATLSVRLTDASANYSTSSVANPAITVDYTKPTATVTFSEDPIMTTNLTQTVTVTYTESMNASTTPTITMVTGGNWGLQAGGVWSQTSVLNDTYTATLTHDTTPEYIATEEAQTAGTSGARDVNGNDDNGDTSDTSFVVDTQIPTLPTGVSFTAVGGNIVSDTLNTSNTNFTASATITAGQATNG
ncbi:MAG: hypothetical protein KAI25_02765, partial [Hyphomicrobiaceae bacterium]|nr:hypothetical protein [Hyphomicrobiaceae bacterium]